MYVGKTFDLHQQSESLYKLQFENKVIVPNNEGDHKLPMFWGAHIANAILFRDANTKPNSPRKNNCQFFGCVSS